MMSASRRRNRNKRDFCCLIFHGFGDDSQAELLAYHLRESGIDTYTASPAGNETARAFRQYWIHNSRMQYLRLRRQYRRIVMVGLESGGFYLMHLADLKPAGIVFLNTPVGCLNSVRRRVGLFWSDVLPAMKGILKPIESFYQFQRFLGETQEIGVRHIACPVMVIQTQKQEGTETDAQDLFAHLTVADRTIRCYPHAGDSLIGSRAALAVCSDVFQFCARIRAGGTE
ncbi:MAG: hypothetical protein ACI4PQ_05335 [Butyricicoccaceae bacterium]